MNDIEALKAKYLNKRVAVYSDAKRRIGTVKSITDGELFIESPDWSIVGPSGWAGRYLPQQCRILKKRKAKEYWAKRSDLQNGDFGPSFSLGDDFVRVRIVKEKL